MKGVIVNILIYTAEMLIAYMYSADLFVKKKKISKVLTFSEIAYLVSSLLNIFLNNNVAVNILSFLIINIVIFLLFYDATLKQSIIHTIILTALMLVSECIVAFSISAMMNIVVSTYRNEFTVYLLDSILSKLLYALLCLLFVRFRKPVNHSLSKPPLYLFVFPFCSILTMILFINISSIYEIESYLNICISVISSIMLLAVIISYILYSKSAKKEQELFELKNELSKVEIDSSYYQILDHQNEEMHTFAHNTKNHLQTIKSLANNSDVDEYIDNCVGELEKYSIAGKTNNKILDLIINKYSVICEVNNINFYVVIKTANLNYIPENDLSALLSNILDNAVEAAIKSNNKRIEFALNSRNPFDVLTCINSCDSIPCSNNGELKTTKDNRSLHGFGTKSIKKIAKKHYATYSWEYDKANKEFVTTIIFERYKAEPN